MDPIEIKYQLERNGVSQADIARELGVTKAAIHQVIFRITISDRIQRVIAGKLGLEPEEVFPDYYAPAALKAGTN